MFRDILVPVDLTEKNKSAIETAIEFATASGGVVRLLHVVQTIPEIDPSQDKDFYQDLSEKATTILDKWRSEFESVSGTVLCEVVQGPRVEETVAYAEDKRCDLIVLTTHRVDTDKPGKGFGTISHQIALISDCPVLLLR